MPSLKNYESNALNSKKNNDIKSSSFIGKPKPPQTTKASKRTEIPHTFVYDNLLVSYNLLLMFIQENCNDLFILLKID